MQTRRLAARWLLPIEGAPIERGALLIGSDGRIQDIGPDATIPRPADATVENFDDAVILPGLINTHTHLELTGLEHQVSEREFTAWIRRLREVKAARSSAEYGEAARRGLASCFAAGVTTIADTGDSGAVLHALVEAGGSGVAYQEVFGPHPDQLSASLAGLKSRVDQLGRVATGRARIGVSPHAPYTVSGVLFRAVSEWARSEQLPLAVHIAESPAESEFLLQGTGPFADAWRARDIPLPSPPGRTPIEWLVEHGVLSERTLCIHAVQLEPDDLGRLADAGAAVSHCPLSNQAHGHGDAPLEDLLESGIRVGLGTDSVVSVGRLDLVAEARAAAKLAPSLNAADLIELCTLAGARALGLEAETGSLVPGKWADCVVMRTASDSRGFAAEHVLASRPDDVLRTYAGGKEVYRAL
jgi:cytosine/adenosine deaminase-related metal-dependent hydrolase